MWFFGRPSVPSAVLIDCTASRAAGAYAFYPPGKNAVICYSAEVPVQQRSDESLDDALLRALDRVGKKLIEEGAPELRRQTGSGRPDHVLVSIGAPWLTSQVRVHRANPGKEFTFTKRLLSELLASDELPKEGKMSLPDIVISTSLNGYDTTDPIGKRTKRAEVVVLASTVDSAIAQEIRTRLRRLYHTHDIRITGFGAAAYGALRERFAHERDFLILDISARSTDLAFIKNARLVDVAALPTGFDSLLVAVRSAERMTLEEEQGRSPRLDTGQQPGYINPERNERFSKRANDARAAWIAGLVPLFKGFAERHALPRTLFLLAEPTAQAYVKTALDSPDVHALWLSDEPLSIIPVTAEQLASSVHARGQAEPDVFLALLALYARVG